MQPQLSNFNFGIYDFNPLWC